MESTNIHHHHGHHHLHEPQLVVSSSSPIPSSYGLNAWSIATSNSNLNSNGSYINPYSNEIQSQQHQQPAAASLVSSQYNLSMPPDLNQFNTWINNNNNNNQSQQQDLHQLSSMKEELAAQRYYTKYTDLLISSSPTSTTTSDELISLRPKFMQKSSSFSSQPPHFYSSSAATHHHDVFGAVNHNLSAGSNFNMDLNALDLLTSSRFGSTIPQNSPNQIRDAFSYGGFHHHMDQSQQLQSYSSPKISSTTSTSSKNNNNGGVGESKRNSSKMEQAAAKQQALQNTSATKKSRVDARASCPPFKVRKEKLGDRIAALQQLVAPFGKTDTASVLMEAIGYIKFLQSQVETLSVPYMKSSRNKASRVIKGVANENDNYEESKRDLQSRGLCLVPLSCLSYISDGGGAAVWPPPHFGGATI